MYSMDWDDKEIEFSEKHGFELNSGEIEEIEEKVRSMIAKGTRVEMITVSGGSSVEVTICCPHCQSYSLRLIHPARGYRF